MTEKITTILVTVQTIDDNKENSQFELIVKQGVTIISVLKEGAGVNWDDGDFREFSRNLDIDVTGEYIEVIGALQDGPWGVRNHWNAHIAVVIRTNQGRQLIFERDCGFRTARRRPRHELDLGSRAYPRKVAYSLDLNGRTREQTGDSVVECPVCSLDSTLLRGAITLVPGLTISRCWRMPAIATSTRTKVIARWNCISLRGWTACETGTESVCDAVCQHFHFAISLGGYAVSADNRMPVSRPIKRLAICSKYLLGLIMTKGRSEMVTILSKTVSFQRLCVMAKLAGMFVLTTTLLMSSGSHADAFDMDIHSSITFEALSFLKYDVLHRIASSNVEVDIDHGGVLHDSRTDHAWHFDNCLFDQTSANINGQYNYMLAGALLSYDSPETFGQLLHPVQDFYSHTNWVELGKTELVDDGLGFWTKLSPFTITKGVTVVQGETFEEPYLPPGVQLILFNDYRVLVNGYQLGLISGLSGWWLTDDDCPNHVTIGHGDLNKDSPERPGHDASRRLAVEQTRHEWCRLVSLYSRSLWGQKAVERLYKKWVRDAEASRLVCQQE